MARQAGKPGKNKNENPFHLNQKEKSCKSCQKWFLIKTGIHCLKGS
jgi:hypothetical protein